MAHVNFDNAIIEPVRSNPLTAGNFSLIFNNGDFYYPNDLTVKMNENRTATILSQTNTKMSIVYSGTFKRAGTSFYLGDTSSGIGVLWEVSNISFQIGDTYSFVIDVEINIGG